MAKYTADQSLIRGAGKVAESLRPMDLSGLDPAIQKGQKIMEGAILQKKAIEKAFETATNGVIMTSGALGDEFYNYTTDKVNGWKDMYYEGVRMGGTDGEKMKMDAMMQMQNWSTFVQNHKQWNIDYAETKKKDMLSSYMSDDDKHNITQILDKKYTLGENANGEMVFNITDKNGVKKQLTHAQYEDLMVIKNYTVDKTYTGVLNNSYKSRTFDRESTQWQILQSLPTDPKQFGAAMADGVQGQSLGSMLTKSKKDGTLSKEIIKAIDTDKDKNISDEELDLYIDVITNTKNPMFDLERSRQIFAERLTNNIQGKHKSAWDENDRVKGIGEYAPPPKDKRSENIPVNYGKGGPNYITRKSADSVFDDMQNKRKITSLADGTNYEYRESINQYVEIHTDKNGKPTGDITPRTNRHILEKMQIWNQGYQMDDFEVKMFDPSEALNINDEKVEYDDTVPEYMRIRNK